MFGGALASVLARVRKIRLARPPVQAGGGATGVTRLRRADDGAVSPDGAGRTEAAGSAHLVHALRPEEAGGGVALVDL